LSELHALRDDARDHVERTSGGEWHDDSHRPGRELLGRRTAEEHERGADR
jgi:hypothetical protein